MEFLWIIKYLLEIAGKRPNKITRISSNISYGKRKINHSCKSLRTLKLTLKEEEKFFKIFAFAETLLKGAISADILKKWLLGDVINLSEL